MEALISHVLPVDRAGDAFALLDRAAHGCCRVVVDFSRRYGDADPGTTPRPRF